MSHPIRTAAYQASLKAMFQLPPERIHVMMNEWLARLQRAPKIRRAIARLLVVDDAVLRQTVFGVDFPRPLGLAAGFDKAATAADCWADIGFGYAELGTITALAQPGNPLPRLFRLKEDRAILNRMGFNNPGAEAVAHNLRDRRGDGVIGVNLGKTKVVPLDGAVDDYRASARALGDLADYVVVNVSSPNTPGLRDLQAVETLRPILGAVQEETSSPVLVKIAPDLSDADVAAVADLAVELGLAGIVATNTTISRDGLRTPESVVKKMGAGGVSGAPVAARSLEVLRLLHERVGDSLTLVSVGGIETPRQAWERVTAGATLLQGYTPLIYGGPDWIRDIHLGLAQQVRLHGLGSIADAVGSGLEWRETSPA
ncbi:quinone-dependent dihydroorotate dehydrogenase [uncultured Corynebacterium sp.]|uniref:quinone-dependent dihydroorotate dehydrogenase n=1 Tax=uncultured Corynebacterium sp. TaxID=159447 RepID=UPI0025CE8908|nr:quinone-dependent dihydroorotate dehydrogenase [uncultured Corynebacterium sp.]